MDLVLGIDIGTSTTKAVLADGDGEVVARAERDHCLSLPQPGWAEHDADTIWWADVMATAAELAGSGRSIRAICVSGVGPCLLPLDEADRPLRPAILYGIDSRAGAEVDELSARYGKENILRRGGSPLTSQAVGPKLLWLRRHEPEVWARTRRFAMASSYAVLRLTGEYVLDHHSASQCDPLYDLTTESWIGERVAEIAPAVEFPRLAWAGEIVGTLRPEVARDLGLAPGIPVLAGTIDAWAEAESVGVRIPGDTMVMYGTTMFFVRAIGTLRPSPALWGTVGLRPGSRTLAAGMATSGALTVWFRDLVGSVSFPELDAEAASVPPGSDGLVTLPYFAGERTPLFDPDARGVIVGLTLRHGRGALYRSLLEATAFGVRHNLDVMAAAAGDRTRLIAVGGGVRGGLWPQIVSDVTGLAQDLPVQGIGASYGDALLAAQAIGATPQERSWATIQGTVRPVASRRALYDEMYDLYLDLYRATARHAHAMAELQKQGGTDT